MKPTNLLALAALVLGLAGCGNKGPLVLPTAPAADAPAPSPDAVPAEAPPTPEALNESTRPVPVEGEATEGGESATPPAPPEPVP